MAECSDCGGNFIADVAEDELGASTSEDCWFNIVIEEKIYPLASRR
jgi:hypothetical protein